MASTSKKDTEKQKLVQDKCQLILTQMLRDEDNKYCVDCDAKGPRWASWNLGIFLCIRCAGIHRNLGVHISRVKSVNLDTWTPEQVVSLQQMGNSRARAVYEANLPDGFKRPQTDSTLESFIRAKYETKKYIAKEWVQPPPVKVSWDAEIEMELKRKKETKRRPPASAGSVELPAPVVSAAALTSAARPAASAVQKASPREAQSLAAPPAPAKTSAAHDLLGLDTVLVAPSSDDLFGGLMSGGVSSSPASSAATAASTSSASLAANAGAKDSDEDSFFNQRAPNASEKRTLDKNSIMALYNQVGNGNASASQLSGCTPNHQSLNAAMFATPHSGVGAFGASPGGAFGQSPALQPMAGVFNPMLQSNAHLFSSPVFAQQQPAPALNHTGHIHQLMSGLHLGGGSVTTPPMMAMQSPAMGVMPAAPLHPTMAAYPNFFSSATPPTASSTPAGHGHGLSTNLWQ